MKIKYLAHASFLIVGVDGTTILTDPYESGSYNGAIAYKPITDKPDIIVVSHDHSDHNATHTISGNPLIIKTSAQAKGISFETFSTYHDEAKGNKRGKNNIVLFSLDDIKLCHAGDLGHPLTAAQAEMIGDVDILFLPVGGYFTIDGSDADKVVEILNPKIVIPMHYKTPGIGFPIAPVESFIGGKNNVERPGYSILSFEKPDLPENTKIIVLEPELLP